MKKRLYLAITILLCFAFICPFCARFSYLNPVAQGSSAECMITIEASTNRILYGKNYNKKRPMASVTKILTAITVIENCHDLNKKHKIPKNAVGIEGSSIYLKADEEISTLDLLYGLMLRSGNDCAVALAILTSGSVEKFADLMNQTAQKAGAKNSNFVNPHGLHHDDHYTTALDLALITSYAMKNDTFKQVSSTKNVRIDRTNRESGVDLANKNKILWNFEGGDGVKTGFTKKAGRCLVASATRNGMQVISVVLNCGPMFEECSRLMQSAFNEFELRQIGKAYEILGQASIANSKQESISASLNKDIFYPLRKGERIETQLVFKENLKAPIKKDTQIGEISFLLNNQLLFKEKMYTIEDTKALSLGDFLRDILSAW